MFKTNRNERGRFFEREMFATDVTQWKVQKKTRHFYL